MAFFMAWLFLCGAFISFFAIIIPFWPYANRWASLAGFVGFLILALITSEYIGTDAEKANYRLTAELERQCAKAVSAQAKFRTEVDFSWDISHKKIGKRRILQGRVKLMNGLGIMIPHVYICAFEDDRLTEAIVRAG